MMRGGRFQVRVLKAAPNSFPKLSKRFILSVMGQAYIIECPKCQYRSQDIMMGVGFLFGSVENILDTLEGHDKDQVQHLVNQGLVHTHYARGFSLYQCSDCHSLDNKVHLTLYNKDGELLFQTESYCGDCQKIREYMPEDSEKETIPDLHCPKCHHDTLTLSLGMLWD